jgi:energy-coupling factor transporter ATP-binding protein EcfA2
MRQILHSYKLRLTNLSQGNRSLKLGRLSRRRDIDLLDLGGLEKASAEELLARLLSGRDLKLIQRLDPRYERTNLADRRLNQIYRQVNTLFEETGTYDLFLGYPFVEGKLASGVSVRCPVALFPVRLHRNLQGRPRWKLESLDDEPIQFNKTFFLAYEQYQQLRLPEAFWEEEIDRSNDWLEWLNDLYGIIKAYELNVNFNARLFDRKLKPFIDFTKGDMDAFKLGVLKFQPQAVLGIFPQSDSALLQDYEVLEAKADRFELSSFFPTTDQVSLPFQPEKAGYIKEEDRYFVTEVDQSQEEALLKVKQGKSLVIHGPPGTGKSQLIVNLIADAMAHGKRVLLVSQKRAALDVVYKRLGAMGLNRFAVLVHDYRHDRGEIFQKIRRQIEEIENFQKELKTLSLTQTEHEYRLLSRQLDQLNRKYETLYQALTSREAFGISTHELYLATDSKALILPFSGPARQLKMASLADFLEKLRAMLDYPELLSPAHSWSDRLSFHHYTYDDHQRTETRLARLPEQVTSLQQQHQQLANIFEEALLKPGSNQQAIDQYRQSQALLNTPGIRKDVEHLLQDELSSDFVKKRLAELSEVLDEMGEMKLLKGFPWRLYSDLKKHVENYDRLQSKKLRILTPAYLRARWFLKKWLESLGGRLDAMSFAQVLGEFQLFVQLKKWYGALYEYRFFQDFPLLEELSEKEQWLRQKQKHLKAREQIQGLKFFPKLKPQFAFGELDEARWEESLGISPGSTAGTESCGTSSTTGSYSWEKSRSCACWLASARQAPPMISCSACSRVPKRFQRPQKPGPPPGRLVGN